MLPPARRQEEHRSHETEVAVGATVRGCAVRRRQLIFRSVVLVLALVGVVVLVIPSTFGGVVGAVLATLLLGVVAVIELVNLIAALRDRTPDHAPPGAWWLCELPLDHPYVLLAGAEDRTWRCRRCGHLRYTPPPRATIDVATQGEGGFNARYRD